MKRKSICWQFVWHQHPMSLSSFLMKCFSPMKDTKYHPSSSVRRPFWADSGYLRRTVCFCGRVWLFDCRSYLSRKEIVLPSAPESTPVVSTMHVLYFEGTNFVLCFGGSGFDSHCTAAIQCRAAKHVQEDIKKGTQGRKTFARRQEKRMPDTSRWGLYFSVSPHVPFWEPDPFLIHFINACYWPVRQQNCSTFQAHAH